MKVLVVSGLLLGAILLIRATLGTPPVFLFLAALALLVAIFFVWSSLEVGQDKKKMSFEEALSFAMPTLAEEQKVAILRALKDLEYEREVGKISEEDYRVALEDYRARAKAYIALADESLAAGREKALAWLEESAAQSKDKKQEVDASTGAQGPESVEMQGNDSPADRVSAPEITLASRVNPSVAEPAQQEETAEKVVSEPKSAPAEPENSGGTPS